jgi:hypothetical protein
MAMAQQQSQRLLNQNANSADVPSPARLKSNFHPRNSVLVPDKRQQIQEIKEMDEGSSSNGERMPSNRRGVSRLSEKVKSEAALKHNEIKANQQNNVNQ